MSRAMPRVPKLRNPIKNRLIQRLLIIAGSATSLWAVGTSQVGNAIANGDTRTIEIYHVHTKESLNITYKRNGSYDQAALQKLNWLLRDWRRDEPTKMDPRLFDIVWETHRVVGSQEPIHVVSAYRAPETNSMLRRRSRAVAKQSQHVQGRAMDFYLPDVSMAKVREIGLKMQRGGVGYYPTAYNPFVHLDSGSVRHWPRMTHDQLARLFPDGKTVHLPANGKPLPGYELALAEIEANGGSVPSSGYNPIDEEGASDGGKSFFARLFGGGDDEDAEMARSQRRTSGRAVASRQQGQTQTAAADANDPQSDNFFARVFGGGARQQQNAPAARQQAPVQTASLPRETFIEPTPTQSPTQTATPARAATPATPPVVELKVANVPLPVARPPEFTRLAVASAGPQTVWVQGPAGRMAPLQGRVADVPLPPSRPGALPARTQMASATTPNPAAAAPALKPLEGKPASVPLPPARPAQLARMASADPDIVGTIGPRSLAAPTSALGYAGHQDITPSMLRGPMGGKAETAQAPALDRAGLKALFSHVSIADHSADNSQAAMKAPQSAALAPSKTIVTKFGQDPANGIATDRFTGPAVKPLSTLN